MAKKLLREYEFVSADALVLSEAGAYRDNDE